MALLGTYANAGAACLPAGQACFAHGLPTTPDFAAFVLATDGGANVCMPVLLCRGSVGVFQTGRFGASAEALFQTLHSIIR